MIKVTDLGIILAGILFATMVLLDSKIMVVTKVAQSKIEYTNIMDSAVDDAFLGTIEGIDTRGNALINREVIVDNFLTSLYSGFGVMESIQLQQKIKGYIPAMVFIDHDGYYISSLERYVDDTGNMVTSHVWKPKTFYIYQNDSYIYNFTLSDYFILYDKETHHIYEGYYADFLIEHPTISDDILSDYTTFDQIRRHTIIDHITNDLNYYINKHNEFAKQLGIEYQFSLPELDTHSWYQTIDDISFVAFIQGFPVKASGMYLNRYAFSSAKLLKAETYYIERDTITNRLYYHRGSCSLLSDWSLVYDTKESAAMAGAYPCRQCLR